MILPKTKSRLSKEEEEEIEKNPNMTETWGKNETPSKQKQKRIHHAAYLKLRSKYQLNSNHKMLHSTKYFATIIGNKYRYY